MASSNLMYVYHLPYFERRDLCRILDKNNKWEELGTYMKYDVLTMQDLQRIRSGSPTDELLIMWGNQNHTVLELFMLLKHMKHYQAMTVIKKFVDPKYHKLIKEGEEFFDKELNIPVKNFDKSEKILNVPQIFPQVSREENESIVVENRAVLKPKSPLLVGPSRTLTLSDISVAASSAAAIPQISYEDLQKSTNNWDPRSILGKGGFGTVFKGTWKCTQVAIKRIEQRENNPQSSSEQIKQSITELHCLNAYRHDNVLPLYGYSIGGPQPCLVYQYMSGGCLEHRLRIRDQAQVLKWKTRLNIAIGTARGLQFLHTIGDKPLVHGDIKSANILLDVNDMPRIGDFGLAREGPHSNYTHMTVSRIHGTRPYLPDEFLRARKFSTKVDTYSFGVVLFELATSLSAYSEHREHKFLKDHVLNYEGNLLELKDRRVDNGEICYTGLIDIGKLCVSKRARDRPEMVSVLIQLEGYKIE